MLNARERFERIERASDLPMAVLALLIVPALILEERAKSAGVRQLAVGLNWVVWLAFCAEFLGKLAFAPSRKQFVRRSWFDLVIIILSPPFLVPDAWQGARAVRAVRLLRMLRFVRAAAAAAIGLKEASEAFRQRRFHYVAVTTIVVISVGAIGIFVVEGGENKSITSTERKRTAAGTCCRSAMRCVYATVLNGNDSGQHALPCRPIDLRIKLAQLAIEFWRPTPGRQSSTLKLL
jgi:hypothetical protein